MLSRFVMPGGNIVLGARREYQVLRESTECWEKTLGAQRGSWVLRGRQVKVHAGQVGAELDLGPFTVRNHQAQPSQITWQESGVTLG